MISTQLPSIASFPPRPHAAPLDWQQYARAFDQFIMDPASHVRFTTPSQHTAFTAFLESSHYGTATYELVTYGPIVLGKLLRGDDVSELLPGLMDYYNREIGIFFNGPSDSRSEMWYLMYANALAAHTIRRWGAQYPQWLAAWRQSVETLRQLAKRIDYDFNHQGYDFRTGQPWTDRDIYRQPDAIGGYAYLMLLGYEMFGDVNYRTEAETALARYLAFSDNPWYEVPDGSMAALAAARLNAYGGDFDLHKALVWLLDPNAALVAGKWGEHEVNGLSRGWRFSTPESAYSMESLMILPFILPVARYDPRIARDLGCYALHVAANARLFYSSFMRGAESRADLSPAIAYERLLQEHEGHSPYATGDFQGHKSIYGGAYALWWDALARSTDDPYILQLDLTSTDFLAADAHPTYLYYNPWPEERRVRLNVGTGGCDLYDVTEHRFCGHGIEGDTEIELPPLGARVLAKVPAGARQLREGHRLLVNDIVVDFLVNSGV